MQLNNHQSVDPVATSDLAPLLLNHKKTDDRACCGRCHSRLSMPLTGWYSEMEHQSKKLFNSEAVDRLHSRELLELSTEDRNALEEEIHGVRCMARDETPEFLQDSLQKLSMILESDHLIPQRNKQAYLRSQMMRRTYVNTDNFRLRFLRAAMFDVTEAANLMVKFLDTVVFLFGNTLLERPLRLSDFSKKELQFLRSGKVQFLPFRDRSGRRIIVLINPITYDLQVQEEFIRQSRLEKVCVHIKEVQ